MPAAKVSASLVPTRSRRRRIIYDISTQLCRLYFEESICKATAYLIQRRAIIQLQSVWRCAHSFKRISTIMQKSWAKIIIKRCRVLLSRRIVSIKKKIATQEMEIMARARIVHRWRHHRANIDYKRLIDENYQNFLIGLDVAALIVQRGIRSLVAERKHNIDQRHTIHQQDRSKATSIIHASCRHLICKRKAGELRIHSTNAAALHMQVYFRRLVSRRKFIGRRMLKSAGIVQRVWYAFVARRSTEDPNLGETEPLAAVSSDTNATNGELTVCLWQAEKCVNARVSRELAVLKEELKSLQSKHEDLLKTGKFHEEFGKMQSQEYLRREIENRSAALKTSMDDMKTVNKELETQVQLEISAKKYLEETNRGLQKDINTILDKNRVLIAKWNESNQERLRIDAETRNGGEKLREMAEQVLQLIEKLKLSDFKKNRALEALRSKEQETLTMQNKLTSLENKILDVEKARVKTERENKVFDEQIQSIKRQNVLLGQRCKEEAKHRAQEEDQRKTIEEKARILGSRLSFLLNKLQSEEEIKIVKRDESKKMEAQLTELAKQNGIQELKAKEARESIRILSNQLLEKVERINSLEIKLDSLNSFIDVKGKELDKKQEGQESVKGNVDPRDFAEGRLMWKEKSLTRSKKDKK